MKDYRKLDLEELDIDDYKILISALNSTELYLLEIDEYVFNKLLSKLLTNLDRL